MSTEPLEGYRLSPQQQRVWQLQEASSPLPYRARCALHVEGVFDTEELLAALRIVITRHHILRTTFRRLPGIATALQVITEDGPTALPLNDLRGLEEAEQSRRLEALWQDFSQTPFDLERGPAVHLLLLRFAAEHHVLFIALPALCADAAALNNLVAELGQCLAARGRAAEEEDEGEGPLQYAVFAEWQHELLGSEDVAVGREFWQAVGVTAEDEARLPFEHPAPSPARFVTGTWCAEVEATLAGRVAAVAGRYGATESSFLLACWEALLSRLTSRPDALVAVSCDGRSDEELAQALGPFERYLPVRAEVGGGTRFADLLGSTEAAARTAYEWQECFTWDLLAGPAGEAGGVPFLPFAFDYAEQPAPQTAAGIRFTVTRLHACTDRFKLRLSCLRRGDALVTEFHYDEAAFAAADMERLAGQYHRLLGSALAEPEVPVGGLELLGEEERRRVLVEFNNTREDFGVDPRLHKLFEAQTARTPDAAAVVFEGQRLTFAQLNARANRLAHYLRRRGVGPEVTVGICVERSLEMVVGLLGILKAGGAYVPLDPGYPRERIGYIVRDARPALLLTTRQLADALREHETPLVILDDEETAFAAESAADPVGGAAPDNLAYVIYTSGSTGRPKGVMIAHAAICNRLLWMQRAHPLGADDRLLQKTSISFDASVWELFVPLMSGATLHVARPGGHQDSAYLIRAVQEHQITTLQLVPSMLRVFLSEPDVESCESLRRVFCGGEALPSELQERFYALLDAELHNLYGPTEVSIDATSQPCRPGCEQAVVPIGKPLSNVQVYLLNESLRPAPVGLPGEVYVGGLGLSRGYAGRPDLTAEKFLPNPFSAEPGGRLYRTGDLGRHQPDGTIEFLGRLDHQVKIRGFRIEPGEIEATLRQHPGVRDAVVLAREDDPGNQQLVAYVVAAGSAGRAAGNGHGQLYRLPNELEIAHLNKNETDLLYKEIFTDEGYLKHGVTLADGDCVFDVGANIGLFTLFVHSKCRGARVFSFEPSPPTFDALKSNVELYGLDAKPYQCAISDRVGTAPFTFYPKVSASSGLYADAAEDAGVTRAFIRNQGELGRYADELLEGRFESVAYTAQLRTVSDIIRENNVEQVDLLKIDVEKSELDVLRGIAEEDWPKIKQLVLEVHDTGGRLRAITELLERHGFSFAVDQYLSFEQTGLYNIYAVHPTRAAAAASGGAAATGAPPLAAPAPLSAHALRHHLGERLPEYMVPSAFVLLDELPHTPNGKIDRQALPAPGRAQADDAAAGPRTPLEELVAGVWCQVLGLERVGVRDNFFDLGGHSLLATQVVSRLRQCLHAEVPLNTIFEAQTVTELAACLDELMKTRVGLEEPPLRPALREGQPPLSFAQQRLWFLDQLEPGNTYFNIPATFRLRGPLDAGLLERTLGELVRRHESLRTTFAEAGEDAVQVIAESLKVPLEMVDLTGVAAAEREARARDLAAAEAARPFDLAAGPLLRARLLRLAEDDHVAVFTMHHIVSDGWSMGVLVKEAMALYEAFGRGVPSPLAELPVQYADYAVWQRELLRGETLARLLDYWRGQLGGPLPSLQLPTDRPAPEVQTYRGARLTLALPEALAQSLKVLSRQESATLFMTLLAAFAALLHRYTKQEDILIGTDVANRNRLEVEPLIGFLINQLVLRADLSGDPSFRQLLARLRGVALDAYAHQDLPFDRLVEELRPARDASRSPLFQVRLVLQNAPFESLELPGLALSPFPLDEAKADMHMTLYLRETGAGMEGVLEYSTDLFEAATAARLLAHFELLLERAVAQPDARLSELCGAIDAAERERAEAEREKLAAASFEKFKTLKPKPVAGGRPAAVRTGRLAGGGELPLVVTPSAEGLDLANWAQDNRAFVEEKLLRHGALLFRGFGLIPHADFPRFTRAVCSDLVCEDGSRARRSLGGHVYTPTRHPAARPLLWHNEDSFEYRWPMRVWFCCVRPAERGGETPIVDGRRVYAALDARLREQFAARGVMYVRNYGGALGASWQEAFQTHDRAEVERLCREARVELEWKDDGGARTRAVRPAVVRHPRTGETVWFNQAQHWHVSCLDPQAREAVPPGEDYPCHCFYGDGSPIEDEVMSEIGRTYQQEEVVWPWQAGDILMLDNVLVAHGRRPFVGERELLVALGDRFSFAEAAVAQGDAR